MTPAFYESFKQDLIDSQAMLHTLQTHSLNGDFSAAKKAYQDYVKKNSQILNNIYHHTATQAKLSSTVMGSYVQASYQAYKKFCSSAYTEHIDKSV